MARKGRLEEILSKALHSEEDPTLYTVSYRDLQDIIEVTLPEFVRLSEHFEVIPASRIVMIKKGKQVLYLKHGFSLR